MNLFSSDSLVLAILVLMENQHVSVHQGTLGEDASNVLKDIEATPSFLEIHVYQ